MKRSQRGIPGNLKPLAKKGERVRFNGFWLNDSPRDRVIADWLDQTDGAGTIVKDLIYRYATGGMVVAMDDLPEASSGAIGAAGRKLGDFDD